ncbi:cytochrome c class I (plasmid) [Paraburkholderia atlantica]|uniref:Cytochrome c class I n=2 Tax=Paraburkholderia atlantica TaxID=2654982 RepID=D5WNP2_PARAM|nr:cytochrome c class I [Paraburkholderia atlantica]
MIRPHDTIAAALFALAPAVLADAAATRHAIARLRPPHGQRLVSCTNWISRMKWQPCRCAILVALATFAFGAPAHGEGDLVRGGQAARACMECHSFAPGRHMTGPSLAGVWGRKAGTAAGFARYSDALKRSGLVFDERHLDEWLTNPAAVVPGNAMDFPGIADARTRADLLAYLKAVSTGRVSPPDRGLPNLKEADAASQVTAIRYCGDTYRLTMADGKIHAFWEFNLRFKTDGSVDGPLAGKPVLLGTGMRGDRAAVVFSRPEEISGFIRRQCA